MKYALASARPNVSRSDPQMTAIDSGFVRRAGKSRRARTWIDDSGSITFLGNRLLKVPMSGSFGAFRTQEGCLKPRTGLKPGRPFHSKAYVRNDVVAESAAAKPAAALACGIRP